MPSVQYSHIPGVHPVVDDGVDHGVAHGQPIKGQVHVLDVLAGGHGVVVVHVYEVAVVGQPAEGEYCYNNNKHSNNLQHTNINSNVLSSAYNKYSYNNVYDILNRNNTFFLLWFTTNLMIRANSLVIRLLKEIS